MTEFLDIKTQTAILNEYNVSYNSYVRPDNTTQPLVIKNVNKKFRGKKFQLRDSQIE